MRRTFAIAAVVVCSVSTRAQQPAPSSDGEAAIIEQAHTRMRFEEDGTGTRETYMRVKVQSDAGVQQWGQVVLGYNAATERLELPLVRVTKADGTKVDTPVSSIQDLTSPVERIAPVYTDYHQKHVTVQSLRPGDTLEVRMVTTVHTPLAARQFWAEYDFNDEAVVLDEQLDIDVPSARRITLKTRPGYDPRMAEAGGRRTYHWTHAHPVRETKDAKDTKETKKNAPDQADPPTVRLTTFADWAEVGRWFSGLERASRLVTPEVRAKAAELTKGRAGDMEKLEALYDYVSKNFRYVSLSLGAGRYQPRPAADVLRDAYGDCKDKHTLLAALIDAAGFQASAALINSAVKLDPDFPSPGQFDHVITRALVGGQVVWLDATPEVAPFRLLSPNLRAKQALVTDVEPARLEETPPDPPMPAQIDTSVDGRVDASGTLSAKVALTFRGDLELALRSAFRMVPAAGWPEVVNQIVKEAGLEAKTSAIDVSDPQATREPFVIRFQVDSTGFADFEKKKLDLAPPLGARFMMSSQLPETDPITLGGPLQSSYRLTLQLPAEAKVRLPLPVAVSRDYGQFRSEYSSAGSIITVSRSTSLTPRELPDSRRSDISSFLHVIEKDGEQTLGIDTTAMTMAPIAPAAEAKRLNQSGYQALTARDYPRAIDLLKRVVELDPKDRTAWNNLGRAYMGLRRIDEAIEAYRNQIELNPYDEYAYNNLGLAYAAKDRTADAEGAYLKQIEVNPLDRYAYSNLGALYLTTHAYEKAATALEKAVTITPDNSSLQVRLGKAYVNLKNTEKARQVFSRAVELSPAPLTWNDVAYELALAGLDLDRAQQYAESAVASAAAASRNLDADRADAAAFAVVNSLAAYWDTLGWVYFAKGDFANAQRLVAPAWKLSEQAEVGDHLGQILEKVGQREKAAAVYAAALSSRNPDAAVREHLARVAGAAKVDAAIAQHRADPSAGRTFALAGKGPAGKKGDFLVLFSAPGSIESVKLVDGDAALEALAPAIRRLPAAGMFPDSSPSRILRQAMAGCDNHGACTVTLVVPEDARPVK
jgi:tetratricopeptide (TPR) repeat protein/transglutaminase-like putative cysteine protease